MTILRLELSRRTAGRTLVQLGDRRSAESPLRLAPGGRRGAGRKGAVTAVAARLAVQPPAAEAVARSQVGTLFKYV
jgi:hypothetical protein